MGLFRSWLEAAVPQTVDLTDGGTRDQGVTYWGAVPKTGSLAKKSKKGKKAEKEKLVSYEFTFEHLLEAAAPTQASPATQQMSIRSILGSIEPHLPRGVSVGGQSAILIEAIDSLLPTYFPKKTFPDFWSSWENLKSEWGETSVLSPDKVILGFLSVVSSTRKNSLDLVRIVASPQSGTTSPELAKASAQKKVDWLRDALQMDKSTPEYQEANKQIKRARNYVSLAAEALVKQLPSVIVKSSKKQPTFDRPSVYHREKAREKVVRSPSINRIIDLFFGQTPSDGVSRAQARSDLSRRLSELDPIRPDDNPQQSARKVLGAKKSVWDYLSEKSDLFRQKRDSRGGSASQIVASLRPQEGAPKSSALSGYEAELEDILQAGSLRESLEVWLENTLPDFWKPLAIRKVGEVKKGKKVYPLFWKYFEGKYVVGTPKKDKGRLTYYSPDEINIKDEFSTLESLGEKYKVSRLGFAMHPRMI